MRKKTTLDVIGQSNKTSLYSISVETDVTTEFEKFVAEFEMILKEEMEKGYVSIEEKELTGIENVDFYI